MNMCFFRNGKGMNNMEIVENKTSYGTFQANEAEYCYKVENNQLRIQRRN